jgi:ABC-type glutathione transport system ATPase component
VAEREACEVLRKLAEETGCALIVVSHYLGLVAEYANRAVLLDRDAPAVIVGSPAEVFDNEAFRLRYGQLGPGLGARGA